MLGVWLVPLDCRRSLAGPFGLEVVWVGPDWCTVVCDPVCVVPGDWGGVGGASSSGRRLGTVGTPKWTGYGHCREGGRERREEEEGRGRKRSY